MNNSMYLLFDYNSDRIVAKSFIPERIRSARIDYLKIFPEAHLIVFQSIKHYVRHVSFFDSDFVDPTLKMLFAEEDQ